MKILIFGGTGVVGRWTARKALERGHDITLHVRDQSRVPDDIRSSGRVKIIVGTLADEESLSSAIRGQDVILSSLGPAGIWSDFQNQFVSGYRTILRLMRAHRVYRILAMGTISIYDESHDGSSLWRDAMYALVYCFARRIQREVLGIAEVFRAEGEGLEWTLYRVGALGNSEEREDGEVVAEAGWVGDGRWNGFVQRRHWANWMVQEAERGQPLWVREMPAIFSPRKK